jgi:hypothetical protein
VSQRHRRTFPVASPGCSWNLPAVPPVSGTREWRGAMAWRCRRSRKPAVARKRDVISRVWYREGHASTPMMMTKITESIQAGKVTSQLRNANNQLSNLCGGNPVTHSCWGGAGMAAVLWIICFLPDTFPVYGRAASVRRWHAKDENPLIAANASGGKRGRAGIRAPAHSGWRA